jgi:DNA-3-methyladenine glycosylase
VASRVARRLPRSFYARECLVVAEELIGMHLVHRRVGGHVVEGRIVETEAYIGEEDQACHARFGRTRRASLLFGPPGHAYVFLIYGMYDCFNVVTEPAGRPAAVLVRAVERGEGLEPGVRTDGPGKLCRALGITRAHNGLDVVAADSVLWLEDRGTPARRVMTTPRIGVEYAGEWAKKPWRFIDADSPSVSRILRRKGKAT